MRSRTRIWSMVVVAGTSLFVLSLILALAVFPYLVEQKVSQTVVLDEGSETWDRWTKLPIPLLMKLYVFNVTNPEDVMDGAKPILKEIGPYVYNQWRHKDKIKKNVEDDEVTYEQYLNHQFDEEESGDLREDDHIVVLNPALMGMLNLLENVPVMKKFVLLLNALTPLMFPGAIGVFLKTTPGELFFKGVRIHCKEQNVSDVKLERFLSDSTPPAIKKLSLLTMCSSLKRIDVPTITEREDKDVAFSVFGHKNRTTEGAFTIRMGLKDSSKLGMITAWKGKHFVDSWGGPTCNAINGTAGDLYSPFLNQDSIINVFSADICRSMKMRYVGPTDYKGIPGLRFRLDRAVFADPSINGDNYCFCPQRAKRLTVENACLKTGALDVSSCQGVPVIMTFPHFLLADRTFLDGVEGLHPDPDKHEMTLDIEPYTGTPLKGGKKMQINFHMKPIDGVNFTRNLPNALMPVLWMYEGIELNDNLVDELNTKLVRTLKILDAVAYTTLSIGIVLILVSAGMMYRNHRRNRSNREVSSPNYVVTATS